MEVNLQQSPMSGPCGGASSANIGVELRATRYDEVSSGYIDGNVEWVRLPPFLHLSSFLHDFLEEKNR